MEILRGSRVQKALSTRQRWNSAATPLPKKIRASTKAGLCESVFEYAFRKYVRVRKKGCVRTNIGSKSAVL